MKTLKRISAMVSLAIMMLMMNITAFADGEAGEGGGGLAGSVIVTGTKSLINDATAVITGLGIAVAILGSGYFLIRRALADEQDKKQWNGRIITSVVSGIGVAIVSSLVGVIAGYFIGG